MFTLTDFVQNNRTREGMAETQVHNGSDFIGGSYDPGLLRPYIHNDGQVYVDVTMGFDTKQDANGETILNAEGEPQLFRVTEPQRVVDRVRRDLPVLHVNNATALRKDQWIKIDATVGKAVRARLQAYADLRANVSYGGFDAMSVPILEREIVTDPGEAVVDMDGLSEGRNMAPKFSLQGLPLPITHSDFWMSKRFLQVSRTRNTPQDTTRIEIAARRVGESIEQTTIGNNAGIQYGISTDYEYTSKVYGYLTHPDTISFTSLISSASMAANISTTGGVSFVQDVIDMVQAAYAQNFYGPFVLYVSTSFDALLDNDFKDESDKTIRQRLQEIGAIRRVQRLDHLTTDRVILVQMTEDVVQAVNGMEVVTVQWETHGGMKLHFKVMGIQVPYIKSVYKGPTTSAESRITGVVIGS